MTSGWFFGSAVFASIIATMWVINVTSPWEVVRVVDGDTIDVAKPFLIEQRVRLRDVDTPEIRGAKCEAEANAGFAATQRVRELTDGADVEIYDTADKRDRWWRTVARVMVGGSDLGETLISEGLARDCGAKRCDDWCEVLGDG